MSVTRRHPDWIKVRAPGGAAFAETRHVVNELGLHTVCEEAHCPNLGECWGNRTATFMLLGEVVEHARTEDLFLTPRDPRTADYVEGRYG